MVEQQLQYTTCIYMLLCTHLATVEFIHLHREVQGCWALWKGINLQCFLPVSVLRVLCSWFCLCLKLKKLKEKDCKQCTHLLLDQTTPYTKWTQQGMFPLKSPPGQQTQSSLALHRNSKPCANSDRKIESNLYPLLHSCPLTLTWKLFVSHSQWPAPCSGPRAHLHHVPLRPPRHEHETQPDPRHPRWWI